MQVQALFSSCADLLSNMFTKTSAGVMKDTFMTSADPGTSRQMQNNCQPLTGLTRLHETLAVCMQVQALFSSCADLLTNMFPDLPAKFSHNVGSARKMQRLAASMLIPADEVQS